MGSCRPPAHSAPHGHRSQHCRPAFEEQTSFYVPGWRRGARGSGLSPTQGWQGGFSTRLPGQGRSDRAGPVVPGPDRSQCHSGGVSLGPGLVGSRVARSELVLQLRFPGPSGGPRFPGQAAVAAKRDLTAAPAQPTRTHLPEGATHRPEACGRVSVPSARDGGRAGGERGKGSGTDRLLLSSQDRGPAVRESGLLCLRRLQLPTGCQVRGGGRRPGSPRPTVPSRAAQFGVVIPTGRVQGEDA